MSKFFETTIKNFSGTSSETKPTIAAGANVLNGSRWREVDTGITYYFNSATDKWYAENSVYGEVKVNKEDNFSLLNNILKELQIMNIHLSMITGENITRQEVE